mgnify:CR=1 FL=1
MNPEQPSPTDLAGSISIWLGKLPAGDHAAQDALLRRYRHQVTAYANYRLLQLGVRSQEADDVAQDVFLGLFRRAETGSLPDLDTRDQLWQKLRQITWDRVRDARRKKLPFTESAIDSGPDGNETPGLLQVADQQLDECFLIVENELVRRKLAECHPDLPEIVRLKVQGHTVSEIAETMQVPKRTIERRIVWINKACDEYVQGE